jgi:26S proteasome regulatory subunit N2
MEMVIDKMFNRCFQDKQWKQAIGIAIDSRRLDKVKDAIELSNDMIEENLGYTFLIAHDIIKSKVFRTDVLKLLLMIYQKRNDQGNFDHYKIAKCQYHLNLPVGTAALLEMLVKQTDSKSYLHAYQISFDICDKENQSYQRNVLDEINKKIAALPEEDQTRERLTQITTILKGEIRDRLYLQFLKKNNHMDMAIINNIKKSIGSKSSILHGATIWSYGMMNAYTTNDTFLKDNLQWVGQVTNWNRFNATASLGLIHSGNKAKALEILEPYFAGAPSSEMQNSPYTTAGAYFAYGLIH